MIRLITNNFFYKVTAFCLAIAFWYIVQGEENLEVNRKVKVSFEVPHGYMIKGPNVRYKDATISGPRVLLGDFSSQAIEAEIKISEGSVGPLRFRVDKEYIPSWNPRIKLTVHDAYINIYVDESMTRYVNIKEQFQGLPAEGFLIEKTYITPNRVKVTGLKTDILRLKSLATKSIDITGLRKSTSIEAIVSKGDFEPMILSHEKVQVNIQVGEKKINRKYSDIPIDIQGLGIESRHITIEPDLAAIVVQGTPGILSFIKKSDLRAFVDVSNLPLGQSEKKLQVKIPSDTTLIETLPEQVKITVSIDQTKALKRHSRHIPE